MTRAGRALKAAAVFSIPAAIGAAVADERPSVGALVGTGVTQALLWVFGAGFSGTGTASGAEIIGFVAPRWALFTGVIGGGGAAGAALSRRHPVLGAAAGAAASTAAMYLLLGGKNDASKPGVSGAFGVGAPRFSNRVTAEAFL